MIWCFQKVHQYLDESYRDPAHCLLLCLVYVCCLLNVTASPALDGSMPIQALTGQVPDISHFLHFSFWEPVYYKVNENEHDHKYPSQSNKKRGHWVGFAENKGDQLTWKILTAETQQIITRSSVRSATKTSPNLRLNPLQGEDQPQDLTSDVFVYSSLHPDGSEESSPMSILNFDDLLGEHFCFLWMRMGTESEQASLTMSTPWMTIKLPEKTNSGSNSKLMENSLMTLSPTINSWSIWRTLWILDELKMDSTSSNPS